MRTQLCMHCLDEKSVNDDWPHWECCQECKADGHSPDEGDPRRCDECGREFSRSIAAIEAGIDARVLREGLVCVKESMSMNLRVGAHYKVVSLNRSENEHWTTVIDDSGEARAYPAGLFRSVGCEK